MRENHSCHGGFTEQSVCQDMRPEKSVSRSASETPTRPIEIAQGRLVYQEDDVSTVHIVKFMRKDHQDPTRNQSTILHKATQAGDSKGRFRV